MRVFYEQKIQEICGTFGFPHKIQDLQETAKSGVDKVMLTDALLLFPSGLQQIYDKHHCADWTSISNRCVSIVVERQTIKIDFDHISLSVSAIHHKDVSAYGEDVREEHA
ncbi:hypothetical protein Syun_018949 [Stephania yunnanensis]|uniref:Uncharacterized protein n=1 Tax=Stephania yunnanensis TaxID=152371 RepID=A0AAP0IT66_9MAGN